MWESIRHSLQKCKKSWRKVEYILPPAAFFLQNGILSDLDICSSPFSCPSIVGVSWGVTGSTLSCIGVLTTGATDGLGVDGWAGRGGCKREWSYANSYTGRHSWALGLRQPTLLNTTHFVVPASHIYRPDIGVALLLPLFAWQQCWLVSGHCLRNSPPISCIAEIPRGKTENQRHYL